MAENKRRLEVNKGGDGRERKRRRRGRSGRREGGGGLEVMGDEPRWDCDGAKFGKQKKCVSVCACVCVLARAHVSGDLLNRPRFQFHASEFDGGGGGRLRKEEE